MRVFENQLGVKVGLENNNIQNNTQIITSVNYIYKKIVTLGHQLMLDKTKFG